MVYHLFKTPSFSICFQSCEVTLNNLTPSSQAHDTRAQCVSYWTNIDLNKSDIPSPPTGCCNRPGPTYSWRSWTHCTFYSDSWTPGYDCRTLNIIMANLFRQRVERVKSHFLKWPNVKQKQSSSPKPDYSWTDRLRIIKWLQLSGSLDLFNTSDAHRQTAKRVARCFPREATPTKTLFLFRYSPGLSRVSTINHWVGEIDLVQSPRDKKEKTTHP